MEEIIITEKGYNLIISTQEKKIFFLQEQIEQAVKDKGLCDVTKCFNFIIKINDIKIKYLEKEVEEIKEAIKAVKIN